MYSKEYFMQYALEEAKKAYDQCEVPVGAVIVYKNEYIVSKKHNSTILTKDSTAHAEINAIREACSILNSWRLDDCTIYVTLEPCIMCLGAILNARLKYLVIGVKNIRQGGITKILKNNEMHNIEVVWGILEDKCSKIISSFFQEKRAL